MMDAAYFRGVLEEYLVPMFSGTSLGQTMSSNPAHALVAYRTPIVLLLKPSKDSPYRVELCRSQPFIPQEKQLVTIFMEELSQIVANSSDRYFSYLMDLVPRFVIGRLLSARAGRRTLEAAIERFEILATETYEGQPVVAGLGITGSGGYGPIHSDELWDEDFARVLSNGLDSIYVSGRDGRIFNLEVLQESADVSFAPHRFGSIAAWSASPNRVALVLNRKREILVFKEKTLHFAKRRGSWQYYAHDSVVSRLGVGDKALRRAVYETCLDVSFGRAGGCIAVLTAKGFLKLTGSVPASELIATMTQTRTRLLGVAVRARFQNLDRRLRQELLSMDGATVLNHRGEVLAAGSIVYVPGGSKGGGRRAAAIQLSKLGLGIKISADGPITGFRSGDEIFSL